MARKKKHKKHRLFWFLVKLQIVLMLVVLGGIGYYYFGGYARQVEAFQEEAARIVAASSEKTFLPSKTSAVYDVNGVMISERAAEKDAEYIAYEDIPASFISAIISIEDKKFYKHNGVDVKAIVRAAKAMIVNGEVTQGGSTITMQLAKLMFMDTSTKTWEYKVQQMFIAVEMEKRYSKSQIMEFYLNNIYFANGYYGIEAACHGYFNCEPNELDISQVAFLLAIPNSPTYYDPLVNYDNTIDRRDLILKNLWEDGRLSEEEYYSAKAESIVLQPAKREATIWNNYVDTYAYRCATMALMEQRGFEFQYYFPTDEEEQAYDEAYDELFADCQKELYSGGYSIYTSIDITIQQELQDAIDTTLAEFTDVTENGVYELQGAGVCIDNSTGEVIAIVGGRTQEYTTYTLNRAYQSFRQPGSSIKPLNVYAPSFEKGYTLESTFMDEEMEDGPSNSGGSYYGEVTLETAIAKSLNTVAWQLYEEITPEVGLSYLKKMNFTKIADEDYGLASALGGFTNGVSPLEMAAGFATIENDGVYREPTCVKTILDSDQNVVYESQIIQEVVYSETAARMTTAGLCAVMEDGTGKDHKLSDMPCAGKTGTTNQNKDGWFVGFTRYYTTSVWVGCDTPKEIEDLKGSTYPGTIWNTFMTKIHESFAPMDFLPYAQLSEDFLDAQEEEQNRYHPEDEEDAEGVEDEEDEEDGENAEDEEDAEDEENAEDEDDAEEEEDAEAGEDAEGVEDEEDAEQEEDAEEAENAEDQEEVEDAEDEETAGELEDVEAVEEAGDAEELEAVEENSDDEDSLNDIDHE
jgi:membrane peptidoglycan carboxypeptidase